ncbi:MULTISPECIES: hypothetical protein [Xanthomonas]|uniref:Lipoprotein n=2 Tax=Xanthomonas TaxID=338 RepID=A0A7Z7IZP2_XANCH|nr:MULTISPECIES: hypothetical protein [Xanthomonas]ATS40049.1 hypothetical protein XcfCFBP6988P_19540 [Xanthomonas citri pv. phaseoli var. fuscans]ATS41142.1 hypothetical protein XcfCFBP6989P_00950 [Xanthomonas citri pv. phaseoli var. fuscans]ATS48053.1 hypothetical protein XcfCFBP6990P_16410 [Xanthomonas citri pv. phaseoli var. fuscans]ATS85564.1 hypothetical protein XcfCFBP6991P_17820 [Xanthomonas citri pv. phaseoli var. fuscans]QWN21675.1 hypothetical protein DGM98_17470 [Xanthomonas citri]
MNHRLIGSLALMLAMSSCAMRQLAEQQPSQREDSVDQRMLPSQPDSGGATGVQPYTLAPTQRFRMPRAVRSEAPVLAADSPRQSLAPTTVCAHLILSADGSVQRVDPMSDRDECAAGLVPDNADLMQAVRTAALRWQFVPAAMCTYPSGAAQPAAPDDCTDATQIEPVPVTLSFAFTFEVRQGKVSVRTGKVVR